MNQILDIFTQYSNALHMYTHRDTQQMLIILCIALTKASPCAKKCLVTLVQKKPAKTSVLACEMTFISDSYLEEVILLKTENYPVPSLAEAPSGLNNDMPPQQTPILL